MIRAGRNALALLNLLGDLLALTIAFEGAAWLRISLNPFFRAQMDEALLAQLIPPLGLVLLLWIPASTWMRLYRHREGPRLIAAVSQVAEAMALVLVLTIVVTFFFRDLGDDFSRSFILFLAALGVAMMMGLRTLLWLGLYLAGRRGIGQERVLILGRGKGAKSIIARLEKTAGRAVQLCGVVVPLAGEGAGVLGNPVPVVGAIAELPALINRHRIDRVIAVEKEISPDDLYGCISVCTRMGVPLSHTAGILQAPFAEVGVTHLGSVSLIEVRGLEFTRAQQVAKRAFDLLGATLLLVLLSPLLLALAVLVRITSRGPILYVAPRVGRGGRHFPFLKFRTMVAGAESQRDDLAARNEKRGHLFKIRSDPRVTRAGRLMRRFSLDELPQLLNVLKGEMSLVGPRPLPARDLDLDGLSREYRFWAKERCRVPPGITGLWQVRGRSDLGFEEMLRLDVAYARSWSIWKDVAILFRTIPAVLAGRGAC
jgi:exopolysaccharide biosynthesis polyprenyl glycosylphosphotransferase